MIYFDNAATTYPKPNEVYQALDYANRNYAFNSGRGSYESAKSTFKMIQETRGLVASFVGVPSNNVVFTSSATESLNLIINGIDFSQGDVVYVSPFEHNAIIRPLYSLEKKLGIKIIILPFDKNTWEPDYKEIENLFALNKPKAIFLSHVSNVTGFILPYDKIFSLGKRFNSINVLDSAQSFGILNIETVNVDLIVFAGHKSLYASFGIAGFIFVKDINLSLIKSGGTGSDSLNPEMPKEIPTRFEAGSQNSVAIAGLNASIKWIQKNNIYEAEQDLTNYLIEKLKMIPNIVLYLPKERDTFGIVSFNLNNYLADDIGLLLNEDYNICIRTGYHCAPLIHDFIGSREYSGTARISLGAFNTKKEIDSLYLALKTF